MNKQSKAIFYKKKIIGYGHEARNSKGLNKGLKYRFSKNILSTI